jgi:alkylation response protein AidB-like acyl-CoA dehydrogenase
LFLLIFLEQRMSEQDFSEHRVMLSNSVTDFARGVDMARVRKLRESNTECDRAIWKQMADLGWLGVLVPEAYGGMALKLADMAIVAQGLARSLVPEPLTAVAVLAARVLADSNNESLKATLLEGLVSGEILPATAWQEAAGTLDVAKINTQATPFEGGFRVNGSKRFMVGAAQADGFIVSANSAQGLQLLWVPRDAAGATLQFDTLADGRQSGTLNLSNVTVAKEHVIHSGAAAAESLARAIDHTAAIASAELCGIMGRALEITLEYLKTRVQFGKAIGSFQALQHRAVDLYIQQELSTAVLGVVAKTYQRRPNHGHALIRHAADARTFGFLPVNNQLAGIEPHAAVFHWPVGCEPAFFRQLQPPRFAFRPRQAARHEAQFSGIFVFEERARLQAKGFVVQRVVIYRGRAHDAAPSRISLAA